MLEFLTLNPKSFGIDISDRSLKIVKLKKKRGVFDLACWGETEIEPGIIEKGEVKDKERLAQEIKKSLTNLKGDSLKTKYVIVSLPEEKTFLQVVQMPKMKEEELKKSVFYEAENYIPLPVEDVYLDCQEIKPIQNSIDHLDVLINALPKKIVDPYVFSLKKAGLSPRVLEIESQAIIRALVKNGTSPFPLLLIDFGRSRTSFILFVGRSLRFTFSTSLCSENVTNEISKKMNLNFRGAEKIKINYNLKNRDKDKKSKRVFNTIEPTLIELLSQTKKYLDFYKSHASHEHLPLSEGGTVKKIILCGGGANLKGLDNYISEKLEIPVEVGNPWINISDKKPKKVLRMGHEESLSFTTALGLALRGIEE